MALNLRAILGLDASGFEMGLDQANRKAKTFAEEVRSGIEKALTAGAIVAAANRLGQMFDNLAERAKAIRLGAQETGFNPTNYQMFNNTLEATGVNANVGANSLEKLAAAIEEVKNKTERGGKLATDFAQFGVSLDDIARKDHRQVFFQIADAMREMEVTGSRLTSLGNILGGKAGDLIPAMKLGFTSRAASGGLIDEAELARIDQVAQIGREGAQGWKSWGNEVAVLFGKIRAGLASTPGMFADQFSRAGGGGPDTASGAKQKILQGRLNAAQAERAKEQNDARIKSELDEKRSKDAAKIEEHKKRERDQNANRTADLKAQAAAERFSLLTADQKLVVLKAQAEVLAQIQRRLKEEKAATGDPTGKVSAMLAQNEFDRVKNLSQQRSILKGSGESRLSSTPLQQIGAQIIYNPLQTEVQKNTVAVNKNTEALLAARRRALRETFDGMSVQY